MIKYTDDELEKMVKLYNANTEVREIAEILDKPERSIIGKLSNLGIYRKKVYLTKRGEKPITKMEIIADIADLQGIDPEDIAGLVKSDKVALLNLFKSLK